MGPISRSLPVRKPVTSRGSAAGPAVGLRLGRRRAAVAVGLCLATVGTTHGPSDHAADAEEHHAEQQQGDIPLRRREDGAEGDQGCVSRVRRGVRHIESDRCERSDRQDTAPDRAPPARLWPEQSCVGRPRARRCTRRPARLRGLWRGRPGSVGRCRGRRRRRRRSCRRRRRRCSSVARTPQLGVVLAASYRVTQDVVRFVQPLHHPRDLGPERGGCAVGMELLREPTVRGADVVGAGVRRHAEDVVVRVPAALARHCGQLTSRRVGG
jgi:hypothetical protein